ncbi:MAG: DUF5668 domain-containing protein [Ignavibacteriales bacterium]|nr:DUF5668 domain-containing protein [Ignavibacteriales bacterium]
MKLSTLFWGILLIAIGGLFLLNNLGVLNVNWETIWRLWPMVLVFWGLSILVGRQRPPWYVVVLMIFLLLFMIAAAATSTWFHSDFDIVSGDGLQQKLEEPFAPKTEKATFRLQSGAGRFYIRDTTSQLIKAETETSFGKYALTREQSDNSAYVTLDFRGRNRGWNFGNGRNRVDVRLNPEPIWTINLHVGAASGSFDLSPFKVEELTLDAGASSMKVRFGDRAEETRVKVKTGAASTSIEVPASVGCEVRLQTALSGKRIRGFEKISGNRYQTSDFESAAKKIYIDVSAGVSQIRVDRY